VAGGRAAHHINTMTNDALNFTLFQTEIGCCGIVWSGRGIAGVQIAEKNEQSVRNRMMRRYPDARQASPPPDVQSVIVDIVSLLKGEAKDLSGAKLDLDGVADFNRRVYDIARTIRPGETLSYGEIAARLGDRNLARDVAQALSQNPFPVIVPCHRVLAAGGKMGGFSAPGGVRTKLRMLSIEGARYGAPTLFDRLPWVASDRRPA
jgi:methylated-DNA-[protein]-cysteine S-methyltransferase